MQVWSKQMVVLTKQAVNSMKVVFTKQVVRTIKGVTAM